MKRRKKQRAADCTITAHASTSSKRVAYNLGTEEERNIKYATLLLQRAGSDCRLKDLEKMATVAKRATGNAFMAHCSRLFSKYRQQCCDLLEECTPLREGDPPIDGVRIKDVRSRMRALFACNRFQRMLIDYFVTFATTTAQGLARCPPVLWRVCRRGVQVLEAEQRPASRAALYRRAA